jgi:hypothetical protein
MYVQCCAQYTVLSALGFLLSGGVYLLTVNCLNDMRTARLQRATHKRLCTELNSIWLGRSRGMATAVEGSLRDTDVSQHLLRNTRGFDLRLGHPGSRLTHYWQRLLLISSESNVNGVG